MKMLIKENSLDNSLVKNMLISFVVSTILGVIVALITGVGIVGIAVLGLSQAVIMIFLYVHEHNLSNILTDSLTGYLFKPVEEEDYLKISVKLSNGSTATKMVSVSDLDSVINSMKEVPGVQVTSVNEYLIRKGNEDGLAKSLQYILDN